MNNSLPQSDELMNEQTGLKLLSSHNFWAKNRLLFNLLVGIAGLVPIFLIGFNINVLDILGIIFWGVVANGLYSFGYVLESSIIAKGNKDLKQYRLLLFWLGTLAYAIVTFWLCYSYFSMPFFFHYKGY